MYLKQCTDFTIYVTLIVEEVCRKNYTYCTESERWKQVLSIIVVVVI